MPLINKHTGQRKTIQILVFNGGTRNKKTCPGRDSKTQLLAERSIEDLPDYVNVELLDMSVKGDGVIIQPCKGCIGTAGGYHCHWPCLPATERVQTQYGWKSIAELQEGDVISTGVVSKAWKTSDSKKILEITLTDGRQIRCTSNHLIKTYGDRQRIWDKNNKIVIPYREKIWKEASKLEVNDKIPFILGGDFSNGSDINFDFFLLAGLIWGDGTFEGHKKRSVRLYYDDREPELAYYILYNKKFMNNAADHKQVFSNRDDVASEHMRYIRFPSWIGDVLKDQIKINKEVPVRERRLPHPVMNGSVEEVCNFLDGWFSTDGSVIIRDNRYLKISLCSASYHVLRDAQLLLAKLGIKSGVRNLEHLHTYTFSKDTTRANQLDITGPHAWKYMDIIGFSHPNKANKVNLAIRDVRSCDIPYSKVKSIKEVGNEAVYDITVETSHEFVAEGIPVHNCTCYGPKSGSSKFVDWMYENDVYKKLEKCDGFAVFSPIHWYNVSGPVKAMFDRLVCASETLTKEEAIELTDGHIKDPEITEKLSKSGDYDHLLKNHLEGKFAAFFVHGDSGADDYTTRAKPKSLIMYIEDEAETDKPYNAVRGIVNTCRYMGIYVPSDLVNALHINKGVDYAEAEDRLKANEKIFEDARSMILKLVSYVENHVEEELVA